eukprot:TRINITY_DN3494_c0_g1_i3.p1 TRINITY_DN3494_c0_g1~~TRINITY_DN3494_c0_g1_i3.p1  ORF type:complete len:363 (+),score=63.62 TRINITY_DN3494_c0_g1_i3:46-1134(+)
MVHAVRLLQACRALSAEEIRGLGAGPCEKGKLVEVAHLAEKQLSPHPTVRASTKLLREGVSAALAETCVGVSRVRCIDRRYEELSLLGTGSFGRVSKCVDIESEEEVAVKELDSRSLLQSRRALSHVLFEIAALATLSHPNVVSLKAVCDDGESLYIVMELCPGCPLTELQGQPVHARPVAQQLLSALVYIHGQGVVHRDVKPANVLYDAARGIVKLIDFSFAKYVADAADAVPTTPGALTVQAASFEALQRYIQHGQAGRAASVDVAADELEKGDVYGAGWCVFTLLATAATRDVNADLFRPQGGIDVCLAAKKSEPCVEGLEGGPQAVQWVLSTMAPDAGAATARSRRGAQQTGCRRVRR